MVRQSELNNPGQTVQTQKTAASKQQPTHWNKQKPETKKPKPPVKKPVPSKGPEPQRPSHNTSHHSDMSTGGLSTLPQAIQKNRMKGKERQNSVYSSDQLFKKQQENKNYDPSDHSSIYDGYQGAKPIGRGKSPLKEFEENHECVKPSQEKWSPEKDPVLNKKAKPENRYKDPQSSETDQFSVPPSKKRSPRATQNHETMFNYPPGESQTKQTYPRRSELPTSYPIHSRSDSPTQKLLSQIDKILKNHQTFTTDPNAYDGEQPVDFNQRKPAKLKSLSLRADEKKKERESRQIRVKESTQNLRTLIGIIGEQEKEQTEIMKRINDNEKALASTSPNRSSHNTPYNKYHNGLPKANYNHSNNFQQKSYYNLMSSDARAPTTIHNSKQRLNKDLQQDSKIGKRRATGFNEPKKRNRTLDDGRTKPRSKRNKLLKTGTGH